MSDLARLSLHDPEYISVHAEAEAATPQRLKQYYVPCPLAQKLDLLWLFIKTHLKHRSIVFLATCKQVRSLGRVRTQPVVDTSCRDRVHTCLAVWGLNAAHEHAVRHSKLQSMARQPL